MESLAAIEAERLAALYALGVIGTPPELHFDAVCRTAQTLFSVPIALVSLITEDRQWFKARCGLDLDGTSRDLAFCAKAILSDAPLVIEDAATDPTFAANPLVTGEPHIRFYAGVPLVLRPGIRLGTLCIIDQVPRRLSDADLRRLQDLAEIVAAQLRVHDLRNAMDKADLVLHRTDLVLRETQARYRSLAEGLPQMVWVLSGDDRITTYRNASFRTYYGEDDRPRDTSISRNHPQDVGRMSKAWMEAVVGGHTFEVEGRLRRHDGLYRWHKIVMIPVRREDRVVEWLGTALDIHDIILARDEIEETTDLLRLAQEGAGAGIWEWDLLRHTVRCSAESARMHGLAYPAGQSHVDLELDAWAALVHPDDWPGVEEAYADAVRTGATTYRVEFRTRPGGAPQPPCWLMSFGRIVRDDASGEPVRVVGLNLDVTERRLAQEALVESEARLRVSEERLALALDSGSEGLWDWDIPGDRTWLSDRWHLMLGYEQAEIPGVTLVLRNLVHPDDVAHAERLMKDHLAGRSAVYECEQRVLTKSGDYLWTLARGKVVARDAEGAPLRIVGTHSDISARKAAEQRITHMARHDALTDLPNRALFHENLQQRLAEVRSGRSPIALLFLNLDRFKTVNDTLGHMAGDALLRAIAERLRAAMGPSDTVARLGGDEFAIVVPHLGNPRQASGLAQRIIDAVGQPLDLDGRLVTIGISVGITIAPTDGCEAGILLKNADIALARAKAAGRNTYQFYEPGMDAAIADRNRLEFDLREAVMGGGLTLHYQPIMNLATDRICGFEALMRWPHATRGNVSPGEFIPLAEETGLIVPLGSQALADACREAMSWPGDLRVAVNVSTLQFQHAGLEESVAAALAESGLAPHRLELEITESVLMHDAESVIACLHRLRSSGVRIALDDFGTGYSSLSYLRRFPFDKIKIDRSFIWDIADPDTAAIVRAVVGLGARRGTTITAEGVETPDQLASVRQEGCTEVQGYLVSRPLPAGEAMAFVLGRDRKAAA